jgi:hypothetical protein
MSTYGRQSISVDRLTRQSFPNLRETLGPLAGGDVEDKHGRGNWGNLVFAIDPEMLGPADVFKDKVQVCGCVLERISLTCARAPLFLC